MIGDDYQNHISNESTNGINYFYCMTCPYTCPVEHEQQQDTNGQPHTTIKKKRVTIITDLSNMNYGKRRMMNNNNNNNADLDILGGKAAWDNVDRTATTCMKCHYKEAYFFQMQIRSADEPMTIFYKCCSCNYQWNE
jgi:DNA-directed RNA polymerase subunit M/transcription elongation factor TFIIS